MLAVTQPFRLFSADCASTLSKILLFLCWLLLPLCCADIQPQLNFTVTKTNHTTLQSNASGVTMLSPVIPSALKMALANVSVAAEVGGGATGVAGANSNGSLSNNSTDFNLTSNATVDANASTTAAAALRFEQELQRVQEQYDSDAVTRLVRYEKLGTRNVTQALYSNSLSACVYCSALCCSSKLLLLLLIALMSGGFVLLRLRECLQALKQSLLASRVSRCRRMQYVSRPPRACEQHSSFVVCCSCATATSSIIH